MTEREREGERRKREGRERERDESISSNFRIHLRPNRGVALVKMRLFEMRDRGWASSMPSRPTDPRNAIRAPCVRE